MVSTGCGCRKHSHTNAAANHSANTIESGEAETQFQVAARAGRVVFQLILEGIPSSQANMVIGKGIAKRDRPLMAHQVIARRDQHQPVFGKRKGLKFFCRIDLVPDDADFGYVSGDSAHQVRE